MSWLSPVGSTGQLANERQYDLKQYTTGSFADGCGSVWDLSPQPSVRCEAITSVWATHR